MDIERENSEIELSDLEEVSGGKAACPLPGAKYGPGTRVRVHGHRDRTYTITSVSKVRGTFYYNVKDGTHLLTGVPENEIERTVWVY